MKNMKKEKAITLIALVVTIIVLLILAGVTIMTLTGENGILGKGNKANEENNKQTATEIINLKITNAQIETYSTTQMMPTLQYLADKFYEDNEIEYVYNESQKTATINKEKINVTGEYIYTKLAEYPYEFKIDSNLKLASIDGVEIADNTNDKNYEDIMQDLTNLKSEVETLKQQKQEINDLKSEVETLRQQKQETQTTKLLSQPVEISFRDVNIVWKEVTLPDITLLDSIENYKFLAINYDVKVLNSTLQGSGRTELVAVDGLKYNNSNTYSTSESGFFIVGDASATYRGLSLWFKNSKTLHIEAVWCTGQQLENFRIRNIYGIK